ncbi:MAG TPA: alkaline phosphatase family protein [Armatimonadota bacterium]|nr:alkaline phosphatase family protein [Armatimonadota bacterium]
MLFRKRSRPRVCVIGLDGVPHDLLRRLADDGVMPATAGLLGGGHLRRMTVSLPEISAVSWSSFMTGANPGTHGIFGFTDLKPQSYELRFPSFRDLAAPTFWDRLGQDGRRCVVINQPATYPAREIPGVLISGFVAIDLRKAVYPPARLAPLERMGYRIDVDFSTVEDLLATLAPTLAARERAVDYLWEGEDWDYFQVVITGTDRLHHLLWDAGAQTDHPHHQAFLDYYRAVDGVIGRLRERFERLTGDPGGLFLLSDHGFGGITREVRLNAWLREHGYLEYAKAEPASVADLGPATRAFALDPGRIYLNRGGRFPRGTVDDDEAPRLKAELQAALKDLEYDGQPVLREVFDAADIYAGPLVQRGPDLVCLAHRGFDLKGSVKHREVFAHSRFQGMHTWDDAFFWSASPVKDDLNIADLAEIVCAPLAR